MKKAFLTLALMGIVLVANQDHPAFTPTGQCTGGACFVDTIRNDSIFNNQDRFGPESVYEQPQLAPISTDGLSDGPYLYDPNCQFGVCISPSSGGN